MEAIVIGGRRFKGAKDSTMEHDVFVQTQVAKANLGRLEMLPGEDHEAFALRIFRRAASDGDVFLLLGGLLFPEDLDPGSWTPTTAEQTANFLRKLTREEDKRIVRGQIIGAIMGFMQAGLSYGVISPSSSSASVQGTGPFMTEEQANSGTGVT